MTEHRGRSAQLEEDGQAVHLVSPTLLLGRGELLGGDVDAAAEPSPHSRGAETPDLGVLVPGPPCVGGGEEAELALGCGPEEGVHPRSVGGRGRGMRASDEAVDDAVRARPSLVVPTRAL